MTSTAMTTAPGMKATATGGTQGDQEDEDEHEKRREEARGGDPKQSKGTLV